MYKLILVSLLWNRMTIIYYPSFVIINSSMKLALGNLIHTVNFVWSEVKYYFRLGYHFSSRLTATHNLCLIYFKITWALSILLVHMHKKFEINRRKIKGGCQSGRKVGTHDSNSDLPLKCRMIWISLFWLYFLTL